MLINGDCSDSYCFAWRSGLYASFCHAACASWALERMPIALMVGYHKSVDRHML
jgi:hypothetical protein